MQPDILLDYNSGIRSFLLYADATKYCIHDEAIKLYCYHPRIDLGMQAFKFNLRRECVINGLGFMFEYY